MKRKSVLLLSTLGALLSSAVAMALPLHQPGTPTSPPLLVTKDDATTPAHFSIGSTLLVDARLGHASIAQGASPGETFMFASVTGAEGKESGAKAPPLDLAIVIDRSGSMKGERIANAIVAASGAVERMREGDSVVVVAFDTEARTIVPRTVLDAGTRTQITAAIRSIRLGGDTCISCGLEAGERELMRSHLPGSDRVRRMLLLSDGVTNHGVTDITGLGRLAARTRDQGCSVTTVGVALDFDERVMGTLARESNGNHYFVADAAALPAVFNQEFDSLVASVARDAELVIEPAAGVVVEEVFDRPSRRDGRRILVPLGSFSAKAERSVLMKLKVPADREGSQPVVEMKLVYRDLLESSDATFSGALAVKVTGDGTAQRDLDPFVRARVERSLTARTLIEANELVNAGRVDEARLRIAGRTQALASANRQVDRSPPAPTAMPKPSRARGFDRDFDDQAQALGKAAEATKNANDATTKKAAAKHLKQLDQSDQFK